MALLYGKTASGDYVIVQVTADGQIVSVTDSTGLTVSWDAVTGKPTVFPSDWSIISGIPASFPSSWGEVSGKPTTFPSDWSIISSKPTDFPTTWSLVTETPATFPCTWLELQDKPTTFPSDWDTTADKPTTFPTTWNDVSGKPTVFPTDWSLVANPPTVFPSDWGIISGKPTTFPSTWGEVSGKPLTFAPADTVGTWTPTLESATPVAGVVYGSQTGQWYRIGDLVFLSAQVSLSSHANQTGRLILRGLPFPARPTVIPNGSLSLAYWNNYTPYSNSTLLIYGCIRENVVSQAFIFNRVRQGASQTTPDQYLWTDCGQAFLLAFNAVYLATDA